MKLRSILILGSLLPFIFGFTRAKPSPPLCKPIVNSDDYEFSIREDGSAENLLQFLNDQSVFRSDVDGDDRLSRSYLTPTKLVPLEQWPVMVDDLDFANMSAALKLQIEHYRKNSLHGVIQLGDDAYELSQALKSLEAFQILLSNYRSCKNRLRQNCQRAFEAELKSGFSLYEPNLAVGDPRYHEIKNALFTGYYTPSFEVTRQRSDEYSHAIYAKPARSTKRRESRRDIDFHGSLDGLRLETFYGNDLFDLYLAHIQGNAHLHIAGGEDAYLNYAATNGLRFNFISKYMLEQHYIADTAIETQRRYIETHSGREEEIFSTCPSYVYFYTSRLPPLGSGGVAVTANRSIATDPNYYAFKGLLAFVKAARPSDGQSSRTECAAVKFREFSRFYLDQDMGGAVRGKARADLFFGEGDYAELAAFNEDEIGNIYFLMLKK